MDPRLQLAQSGLRIKDLSMKPGQPIKSASLETIPPMVPTLPRPTHPPPPPPFQAPKPPVYIVSRKKQDDVGKSTDAVAGLEFRQITVDGKRIRAIRQEATPFNVWDPNIRHGEQLTATQNDIVDEFITHLNSVEMDENFEWALFAARKAGLSKDSNDVPGPVFDDESVEIYPQRMARQQNFALTPHAAAKMPLERSNHPAKQSKPRRSSLSQASRHHSQFPWLWNQKGRGLVSTSSGLDPAAIHGVECRTYADSKSPFVAKHTIKEENVIEWLYTGLYEDKNPAPAAVLKLIERQQVRFDNSLPFEEKSFAAVHHALKLPDLQQHRMSANSGFLGRVSGLDGEIVFICRRPAISAMNSVVVSYRPQGNVTMGYILSGDGPPPFVHVLHDIIAQFPTDSHPMLIFLLVLESTVENISSNITSLEESLRGIERKTGYSNHKRLEFVDASQLNYRVLAQDLGSQTCRWAIIGSLIQSSTMLLEFIQDQLTSTSYLPSDCAEKLQRIGERLVERTKLTTSTLKHLDIFGGVEGRLQAQQNVLFNLIAQQDNKLNVEIARDSAELAAASKRDSSAMKIIAFLTTVFLPGTFISSFFAMPLFDWGAQSSSSIVTSHFWVYWAVTIPLTISTMIIIGMWIRLQEKKKKVISKEARDDVAGFENIESISSTDSKSTHPSYTVINLDLGKEHWKMLFWKLARFLRLSNRYQDDSDESPSLQD